MASSRTGSPRRGPVLPDIAWLVHETDNEPLRYSIRSVEKNCAGLYGSLWIVGSMPSWLEGIGHVPVAHQGEKFADIRAKVTALAQDNRLSKKVVVMNDDYYAVEKITSWSPYHMGSTALYLEREAERGRTSARNTWIRAVENTAAWMREQGHGDILCYEGHCPLLFDRRSLTAAITDYPADRSCDYPGFYPIAGAGGVGVQANNAKVGPSPDEFMEKFDIGLNWLSSNDKSFSEGLIGGYIRGMFREPSRWEV